MGKMVPDAIVIAIVIFATNVSLAKTFARRNNYIIDSNQVLKINVQQQQHFIHSNLYSLNIYKYEEELE